MKKVLLLSALAWVTAGVAVSFGWKSPVAPAALVAEQVAAAPVSLPAATTVMPELAQARTQAAAAAAPAEHRELLDQYCVTCHNQRANIPASQPLYLDQANLENPSEDAEIWDKVVRRLSIGAMPPQGMPHPGAERLDAFRTWLIGRLDASANPEENPGRFVLHRLNRAEYANAIRDMLNLDVDVTELLPSDGGDFGFDNVAAALNTSPLLLERYLTAALRIAAMAVGDAEVPPGETTYPISLEVTQQQHVEGLPLGTRGGIVVRHVFPADGEYEFFGRLNRTILNGYSGIEGHDKPHDFIVLIDGVEVYRVAIGGPEDHEIFSEDPNLKGEQYINAKMRVRVPVTAGQHDVGFTWVERPAQEQSVWDLPIRDTLEVHHSGGVPRLRAVSIEGPYNATGISNTPSRSRVFVCSPTSASDENRCAERIFSNLARRAFRRPVNDADIAPSMDFYRQARESGGDFDAGIRAGLARILASPSFLFRAEVSPANVEAGGAHRISDLELASRLSFFLWSSIPDEQLLELAANNRLRRSDTLEQQVRRMLADPRADALVENFTGQWLQLRNIDSRVAPDILVFPDFDDNLRKAMRRETELLFADLVRRDQSVLDLLRADYTFVNERLARHYGIAGVTGSRFRRVDLENPGRRGLLGHASILSLTSASARTSPVFRGKYVMATLLMTPPLPPPPVVPALEESASAEKPTTVREQLELHRSNPVCASCHRNIDPIGFALENFDPLGRWRETDVNGLPVDTRGQLVDGTVVDGPIQLREALLSRPDVFVGAVTENLMVYALGRGLEPADRAVVRSIVRDAAQNDYRFMSIILGIVESAPFQMRTKLAQPGTVTVAQAN